MSITNRIVKSEEINHFFDDMELLIVRKCFVRVRREVPYLHLSAK